MNGPKWRTFGGFKRKREEVVAGKPWDVRCDEDAATVRVPVGKRLVDLTFSYRQNDAFLEKIAALPRTSEAEMLEEATLLILQENDFVVESLPRSKYRAFRRPPKRDPNVENQTVTQKAGKEYFAKLGIPSEVAECGMILAAEAIAKHFLRRKA